MIISVTGKGGVGKTTVLSLLIDEYCKKYPEKKVLVIDGDPDQTLNEALGVEVFKTLGDLPRLNGRAVKEAGSPANAVREMLQDGILIESERFDYMAMGGNREAGCYCAINNALASVFEEIQEQGEYDTIFIDSPAGTEHLNRYRIKHVDLMCLITTQSKTTHSVAERIRSTAERVGMSVNRWVLIENQSDLHQSDLSLPATAELSELIAKGSPVVNLTDSSPIRQKLATLI